MLHALVINDRSDTSLSDYASRLNSVAMNHRRLSRCVSLTLHDRQTCFLSKSVNGRLVLVRLSWIHGSWKRHPISMRRYFRYFPRREILSKILRLGRPSFTFFPARKRISYSRARIYRFRIIKFKIEKGETQFV